MQPSDAATERPVKLQVEYETQPVNIDPSSKPRFSWTISTDRRGAGQSSYQILVSRSRESILEARGDMWDSGWVEDSRSSDIKYDGVPLGSDERYYWTVRVQDETGKTSPFAEPEAFTTALSNNSEWEGEWIANQPGAGDVNGYRSEWKSEPTDEQWVEIDLGRVCELNSITLHPAAPINRTKTPDGYTFAPSLVGSLFESESDSTGGFGFPNQYRIEGAVDSDFQDASVIVDRTTEEVSNPEEDPITHEFNVESVRYIRIVAKELFEITATAEGKIEEWTNQEIEREENRPFYVFALAGVEFEDGAGSTITSAETVKASSNVEERTWKLEYLVNEPHKSSTASDSPLLRSSFDLTKPVSSARLHVAGLGYSEVFVNGNNIGDEVLNPGWTQYDRRILYSSYEIADQLHEGENVLGLWLGNGRFNQSVSEWMGFGSPQVIAQLRVEYADGTTRTVTTDSTWKAIEGPLVENDIYDGEKYDARREKPGWTEPGFKPTEWNVAAVVEEPGGDLEPQRTPPIRVVDTLQPDTMDRSEGGITIDAGQNLTGWLEIKLDNPNVGDELQIEHAENLDENGELVTDDIPEADATDTYIARGNNTEQYHPRFTYHGFRYARISGPVECVDDVTVKVVHTDFAKRGEFDCSDQVLAQIQHNAEWGLRSNAHSIPTDCPQRAERLGWTGDAHISGGALLHNFDAIRFYEKWMRDHADEQARNDRHGYVNDTIPRGLGKPPGDPTWSVTQVVIPWLTYQQYGDVTLLEQNYEEMRRYVEFWHDQTEEGILDEEFTKFGDWLEFEQSDEEVDSFADVSTGNAYDLYNTAYHYWTVDILSKIASTLGNSADMNRYQKMADKIARSFNDRFYNEDTKRYKPWTQTTQALPLYFGIVPQDDAGAVAENLATKVLEEDGGKLQTGFLGTRPLIHSLADHGHADVAFQIVSQPERPGWVYMAQQGATTMWERWDSDEKVGSGMNSFNHSPLTLVSEWFYRVLSGINVTANSLEVTPHVVEDLEWVDGCIDLPTGEVRSRWKKTEDGLQFTIEIPWNTDATVRLPADTGGIILRESGEKIPIKGESNSLPEGIETLDFADGEISLSVTKGDYQFTLESVEKTP